MTVRVTVPPTVERVILIIMPEDHARDDEWKEQEEGEEGKTIDVPANQGGFLTIHPGQHLQEAAGRRRGIPSSPIQKVADRRASEAIDDLEAILDSGQYVLFDEKLFERKAKVLARKDITNEDVKSSPASYDELLRDYQDTYRSNFWEKLPAEMRARIVIPKDEREKQLRVRLTSDRLLVQNRAPRDWHARDLVILRFLQIYYPHHVEDADIVNVLLEQHSFTDRYEQFVLNARIEVPWPQEPF
jgi:hypothetical protein